MIYQKYNGHDSQVLLSSPAEDPITVIAPKAFFGCKQIEKISLPDTVTDIGDWAFSHMFSLQELDIPATSIRFGRKVFLDCHKLRRVNPFPDQSGNPGLPYFLADTATVFADKNHFDPVSAASASTHIQWVSTYDRLLTAFLKEDDLVGFEPVFYGWVNDEDADVSQKPNYLLKQRTAKVRMAFRRLEHDLYLAEADRTILENYLKEHMPWGSQPFGHTAVWDLLPVCYDQELLPYQILEKAGALPTEHIPQLVEHLADVSPEIIAWLLHYQQKNKQEFDFFDSLSF